jgi:hypothetical protein
MLTGPRVREQLFATMSPMVPIAFNVRSIKKIITDASPS